MRSRHVVAISFYANGHHRYTTHGGNVYRLIVDERARVETRSEATRCVVMSLTRRGAAINAN